MGVRKLGILFLKDIILPSDGFADYVVVGHAAIFITTSPSQLLLTGRVKLFYATAVEGLVAKKDA